MQFNQYTKEMGKFLKDRGWDNLRPTDVIKSLVIEAAELLEIFQWDSMTVQEIKNRPDKLERLRSELADMFLYSFQLASLLGLDAEKLVKEKLAKIKKKYPPGEAISLDAYYKIKQANRANNKHNSFK